MPQNEHSAGRPPLRHEQPALRHMRALLKGAAAGSQIAAETERSNGDLWPQSDGVREKAHADRVAPRPTQAAAPAQTARHLQLEFVRQQLLGH